MARIFKTVSLPDTADSLLLTACLLCGSAALGLSIVVAASRSLAAQEPKALEAPEAKASKSEAGQEIPARAVARLVVQLKRHPVEPKPAGDRVGLYLMDVRTGEVTLIADEPSPGLTRCGSAVWSHNGRRILFDATPGTDWSLTRLKSIDLHEDGPTMTDLGTGNCPTFSPADDRISFLSNASGTQNGVWLMKADGSGRRLLGDYGKPIWSPDGRQLMIMSFTNPRQVTLMNANPEKSGALQLPGQQIYAHPGWAGKETIVAVIGATQGDTIALIDVSNSVEAKVKDVLWQRANGPDVEPSYPIYSPTTGRCIFVGSAAKGMALYLVQQSKADAAKRLGPEGSDLWIVDPAFSPDGRFILYSARGPEQAQRDLAPAASSPCQNGLRGDLPASRARHVKIFLERRGENDSDNRSEHNPPLLRFHAAASRHAGAGKKCRCAGRPRRPLRNDPGQDDRRMARRTEGSRPGHAPSAPSRCWANECWTRPSPRTRSRGLHTAVTSLLFSDKDAEVRKAAAFFADLFKVSGSPETHRSPAGRAKACRRPDAEGDPPGRCPGPASGGCHREHLFSAERRP